ncbi:MAG TPA: hypothetical protein VHO72_09480 [Bacteroidales bacterium]|nr:hypothetical protein [Bacteroidales bacterium]
MKKTKRLWILIGIVVLFNLIMFLTRWGGEKVQLYVGDIIPSVCALISSVCLFITFRKFKEYDAAKIAWMLIFIGILLDFIAETTYAVLEIGLSVDINEVFPTIADYIWCSAYVAQFAGLIVMYVGYKRSGFSMGNTKVYSILAPSILIVLSVVIYFVLVPIIRDTETQTIEKVFYLFYPVGDLFIVIPAFILMYITSLFGKGAISRPWKYLAIGFTFFTFADLIYSYLSWEDNYQTGNIIDIAWNAGYLLIGLSGLYQVELIESIEGGAK